MNNHIKKNILKKIVQPIYSFITTSSFITRIITAGILAIIVFILSIQASPLYLSIAIATTLLYIVIVEWPSFKQPLLTPLYPIAPTLSIIALNQSPYRILLFFCAITAISYDMGAYISGSLLGKHSMAPSISPQKTIEGFFGGILLAILSGWCLYIFFALSVSIVWYTISILLGAFCAAAGDLYESWLKRKANLKDAGSVLPGHGGFLDRLDSLFIISLITYIFREYLYTWLFI